MSPTVFRLHGLRFYFFSREEPRAHVHVHGEEGEAKFWLEPEISLARNEGFPVWQLKKIQEIITDRQDEIRRAWNQHFGG